MTVKELIEKLKKFPQNFEVVTPSAEMRDSYVDILDVDSEIDFESGHEVIVLIV
jgi:hypothetical protein